MRVANAPGLLGWWGLLFFGACSLVGCDHKQTAEARPTFAPEVTSERVFETRIHAPARLEAVELTTPGGQRERVRCETCHAIAPERALPKSMGELDEFHVGLAFEHGTLTCASCHAAGQPPKLKLADGTPLRTADAMQLCAQCHGQQFTSYQHGAHGGMNGHWDLRQGERLRNHCVDCHDPHTPALAPVMPMPPPRDRFFDPASSSEQSSTHPTPGGSP